MMMIIILRLRTREDAPETGEIPSLCLVEAISHTTPGRMRSGLVFHEPQPNTADDSRGSSK
jgi:hypothetical protein